MSHLVDVRPASWLHTSKRQLEIGEGSPTEAPHTRKEVQDDVEEESDTAAFDDGRGAADGQRGGPGADDKL